MAVPEISSADPILGLPSDFVRNGTHTAFFVVGYDTSTGVGGPWIRRRPRRRGVGRNRPRPCTGPNQRRPHR